VDPVVGRVAVQTGDPLNLLLYQYTQGTLLRE
jgi:hypothetical protein